MANCGTLEMIKMLSPELSLIEADVPEKKKRCLEVIGRRSERFSYLSMERKGIFQGIGLRSLGITSGSPALSGQVKTDTNLNWLLGGHERRCRCGPPHPSISA